MRKLFWTLLTMLGTFIWSVCHERQNSLLILWCDYSTVYLVVELLVLMCLPYATDLQFFCYLLCWCNVLRWIRCLWCYSECISTPGRPEKHAWPRTYTQSNITSILFTWVLYTNTANIMIIRFHCYRRN
jgi:hypothetical protein